jgi:hypothetical protein
MIADSSGSTPLHHLVKQRGSKILYLSLSEISASTPSQYLGIMKLMLDKGATINAICTLGETPFHKGYILFDVINSFSLRVGKCGCYQISGKGNIFIVLI